MGKQEDWIYTYYSRDAQGNILAIYQKTYALTTATHAEEIIKRIEVPVYGSSRLGSDKQEVVIHLAEFDFTGYTNHRFANVSNYTVTSTSRDEELNRGEKYYELSNHLGNVLAVVSDRKVAVNTGSGGASYTGDYSNYDLVNGVYQQNIGNGLYTFNTPSDDVVDFYHADVVAANDYYPFGMIMPDRSYEKTGTDYRFGFNGMEQDDEVKGAGNSYDFGARIYDPRIGRWNAIDPLYSSYTTLNPYNYCANSPIMFVDDGGEKIIIFMKDKAYEYLGNGKFVEVSAGKGIDYKRTGETIDINNLNHNQVVDVHLQATIESLDRYMAKPESLNVSYTHGENTYTGNILLDFLEGGKHYDVTIEITPRASPELGMNNNDEYDDGKRQTINWNMHIGYFILPQETTQTPSLSLMHELAETWLRVKIGKDELTELLETPSSTGNYEHALHDWVVGIVERKISEHFAEEGFMDQDVSSLLSLSDLDAVSKAVVERRVEANTRIGYRTTTPTSNKLRDPQNNDIHGIIPQKYGGNKGKVNNR